jgi:hypothetical protein
MAASCCTGLSRPSSVRLYCLPYFLTTPDQVPSVKPYSPRAELLGFLALGLPLDSACLIRSLIDGSDGWPAFGGLGTELIGVFGGWPAFGAFGGWPAIGAFGGWPAFGAFGTGIWGHRTSGITGSGPTQPDEPSGGSNGAGAGAVVFGGCWSPGGRCGAGAGAGAGACGT